MNLQLILINHYKSIFPNDTLKDISTKTGIQHTRVFRIFNGAEMKISEYQVLDKIIQKARDFSNTEFRDVLSECEKSLSCSQLAEIMTELKYLISFRRA